jgi:hypothetical protein
MYLAARQSIYSAVLNTEAETTLMFLPSWKKRMTTNPYALLCRKFLHMCKFLGSIPSKQFQYADVLCWNNVQTPIPKHTWDMQIITIWNTKGRKCLNACNKNWLKELAKEIPEAKWDINYIHNDPYPSALSIEKTPGLIEVRKLPSDLLYQTPQCPKVKQVPWTHLRALMKRFNTAPAQT